MAVSINTTPALLAPSLPSRLSLSLLAFLILSPSSQSLSTPKPQTRTPMKYTFQPDQKTYDGMRITSLHRYAVKGLSGDSVQSMKLDDGDGTFADDRRFALLYDTSGEKFEQDDPQWLHKDNFLCAFTAPELLATLDTEYRIENSQEGGTNSNNSDATKRLLTIWNRGLGRASTPLLGPTDLACPSGREETSNFFTDLCGRKVRCVVASEEVATTASSSRLSNRHTHQFGNTSSGVKNNKGDTRTIHIINENTVKQFSDAIYGGGEGEGSKKQSTLGSTRFRPNIIVENLEPWAEFDLIGKTIEVVSQNNDLGSAEESTVPLRFRITSRTVRCAGVGVDPLQPELAAIDIPNLLAKHYPEHGPYLGVYAVVDGNACGGTISVGDTFRVVEC